MLKATLKITILMVISKMNHSSRQLSFNKSPWLFISDFWKMLVPPLEVLNQHRPSDPLIAITTTISRFQMGHRKKPLTHAHRILNPFPYPRPGLVLDPARQALRQLIHVHTVNFKRLVSNFVGWSIIQGQALGCCGKVDLHNPR